MMDRREMMKSVAALSVGAFAGPALANGPADGILRFGAAAPTTPTNGQRFYQVFSPMRGLGKHLAKERKNVFLWKNLERAIGEIVPHYQGTAEDGSPGEGDCVGQAAAMGCDVLAGTDIFLRREREKWLAKASVEMLYAGSRIEVGKAETDGVNLLKGRGGSHGGWVAQWLRDYGVLHRVTYERSGGPSLDLRGYHPGRSREYRDVGVPDWLEPVAKKHPTKITTNIKTGMEGVDALCSGQPIIVCSSYAFHSTRDKRGFCAPYLETRTKQRRGRRWSWTNYRKQWWHAMVATGVVFYDDVIGVLIQNSHGDWNDGPRPFGIPRGSFFVDLKTWELMVTDWFDCWAIGSYVGHKKRQLHKLWR
jgi:hypothetical protein